MIAGLAQAGVSLRIDNKVLRYGQSLQLVYTVSGAASNALPDWAPLSKNFTVLGTSRSTRLSIINGQSSRHTQWVVSLLPKKRGRVTIPSVSFGHERSRVTQVEVVGSKAQIDNQHTQDIFLQASVDQNNPYVQSQVTLKLKLFYTIPLARGQFSPPNAPDSVIMRLGKYKQYQAMKKGRVYQVIEQAYAIFPQKSGALSIKAPIFSGYMEQRRSRNIDQFLMNTLQPIRLETKDISLNVRSIPKNYPAGGWLPAKKLSLNQQWEGAKQARVGQPISRKILLEVEGLTAAQLPELPVSKTNNAANVYKDKPITANRIARDSVIASKSLEITYIPTQQGVLEIPAMTLHWWDTKRKVLRNAKLDAKTVKVGPALRQQNTQPQKPQLINGDKPNVLQKTPRLPAVAKQSEAPSAKTLLIWIGASIAVGFIIVFLVLIVLRALGARPIRHLKQTNRNFYQEKKCYMKIKEFALKGDIKGCEKALISWARLRYPLQRIQNLQQWSDLSNNAQLQALISELEQALYGADNKNWDGALFWEHFKLIDWKDAEKAQDNDSHLPPLNPH